MRKIFFILILIVGMYGGGEHWSLIKLNSLRSYYVADEDMGMNFFGFVRKTDFCNGTYMWLNLLCRDKDIQKFDGKMIKMVFTTEQSKFTLDVSVNIHYNSLIGAYILASYHFLMGKLFIDTLKKSKFIKISIDKNQEIAKYFHGNVYRFNISGFEKVFTKGYNECIRDAKIRSTLNDAI